MKDHWIDRPDVAIRFHRVPRRQLCVPNVNTDDAPPVPITAIEVTCRARTNSENADEKEIDDIWCGGGNDTQRLSDFWAGETVFDKEELASNLRPECKCRSLRGAGHRLPHRCRRQT